MGQAGGPDGDLSDCDRKNADWVQHCPDVLGCASAGKTVEAVVVNMKLALELHFDEMAEDGDPIPKPRGLESYRELMKDLDLDEYLLAHVQIDTNRIGAPMSHS
jgi:predicted RNase H-like HicB family nuclease